MDTLLQVITGLAPFLSAYPSWVKGLFSLWVVFTAALFLAFVLARLPEGTTAPVQYGSQEKPAVQSLPQEVTVARRIRDLLGKRSREVTAYLGEPDETNTFNPTEADLESGRPTINTYLVYRRHGVTFLLWGEAVKTIFFYRQGVDRHLGYKRDVVAGLVPGMTRAEIESRFGRSTHTGRGSVGDYYILYRGLVADCTVTINFDTTDLGDMKAVSNSVLIQKVGE